MWKGGGGVPRGREKLSLFRVCVPNSFLSADLDVQAKQLTAFVAAQRASKKFGSFRHGISRYT